MVALPTTALARRFALDISPDNATWQRFPSIVDFNPQITPNKVDATTYDTVGWASYEVPMQVWSLTVKALRQPSAGVYPPAQEAVRSCQAQFGASARMFVRWYDKGGAAEAWTGWAIVEWNESKTGVADLNEVQVTFTGDGILTPITNPVSGGGGGGGGGGPTLTLVLNGNSTSTVSGSGATVNANSSTTVNDPANTGNGNSGSTIAA